MSRQSKNARKLAKAKEITRMHLAGEKGPARTTAAHGKRFGYRTNPEVLKRIAEMSGATRAEGEKTAGKRILRSAGKAAD